MNEEKRYTIDELMDLIISASEKNYEWRTFSKSENPKRYAHFFYNPQEHNYDVELKKIIEESAEYTGFTDLIKSVFVRPIKTFKMVKAGYKMRKPELDRKYKNNF